MKKLTDNNHVNIEFGHFYIDSNEKINVDAILKSQNLAKAVGEWYRSSGCSVTYSILIDNYSNPGQTVDDAIELLKESISMPDSVYLEGDFELLADDLVSKFKSKYIKRKTSGSTFLAEGKDFSDSLSSNIGISMYSLLNPPVESAIDRFRFALNFDIDYLDSNGNRRISCPVLAAAWQTFRLGGFAEKVAPIYGQSSFPADICVSVLPIDYIQVEASVRAILRSQGERGKNLASRTKYVFY